jgi:hypothetical protein
MSNLSHQQLGHITKTEEEIRRKGLTNPDKGFVGNGFWWGMYPTYVGAQSGYGGYLTAAQADPVSPMGDGASVSGPEGVSAVGGMASN